MSNNVPKSELDIRMERFLDRMNRDCSDWELCAITGGMNMFYLTGTVCDGLLLIKRDDTAALWVRRSFERAVIESEFYNIRPMKSFRDIAETIPDLPETLYIDMANVSLEWFGLFKKYLPFNDVKPLDSVILGTRAVKSEYEINIMKRAGAFIDRLYDDEIMAFLYDGTSEVELGSQLFSLLMLVGYHGVSRFVMRNVDSILGHVAFGDSSIYPSAFNGAAGIRGICPAVPVLGNRDRFLKSGDLIYIDIAPGIDGYHIDKTVVFSYAAPQPEFVINAHNHCLELERLAVSMLKPGVCPFDIYETVTAAVKSEYKDNFMGVKGRNVPFIGHGTGLNVDEMPVLAKGFSVPLEENMTIAIEPKIALEGVGMVGSENTYLVAQNGGISLTGDQRELFVVEV